MVKLCYPRRTPCSRFSLLMKFSLSPSRIVKASPFLAHAHLQSLPSSECLATLGSLNVSNTPECVGSMRTCTFSMPSWQSLTECSVTMRCSFSLAAFLSKVFNNLEFPFRFYELSWCALLETSLLN
jgi:hypothetical protein